MDNTADVQTRLEKLEYQMKQVPLLLEGHALSRLIFQFDLSEQQVRELHDLMRTLTAEIESGKSPNAFSFENRIKVIIPDLEGNETNAYIILESLDGQYPQLYAQLKPLTTP